MYLLTLSGVPADRLPKTEGPHNLSGGSWPLHRNKPKSGSPVRIRPPYGSQSWFATHEMLLCLGVSCLPVFRKPSTGPRLSKALQLEALALVALGWRVAYKAKSGSGLIHPNPSNKTAWSLNRCMSGGCNNVATLST